MKIIQNNNKEILIQIKDLIRLNDEKRYIPDTIKKVIENLRYTKKDEYIKFTDINDIKYFKDIDWIIDYNLYDNMSLDEINLEIKKTMGHMSILSEKYLRTKNYSLVEQYSDMEYKFRNLEIILSDKIRKSNKQKVKRIY